MDGRAAFLKKQFLNQFKFNPTSCQQTFFDDVADFVTCDDADILVVNGYAGTGKTSAVSAVIRALRDVGAHSILLAPTGRAAKVFSQISGFPAYTVHKHIYRQKGSGDNGFGTFSLAPNKAKSTLFVVDEVSLIGIDASEKSTTLFGTGNLLSDLVDFVRSGDDCRLILVGDGAQLPPVGLDSSPALSPDFMEGFGGVRFSHLSTVVRQASESGILMNATALRHSITKMEEFSEPDAIRLDVDSFPDVGRVCGADLIETISDAYARYGEEETIVLCRSNKMAIRYNLGIRSMVKYREEKLVRGDKLMIVKNCYQFLDDVPEIDYIANGDIAILEHIGHYEERYGLHFAEARLSFPDYNDVVLTAKVCLDTLESESPALTYEQQNALYNGVSEDYSHLKTKARIWKAVREDHYFNALQLKYADAITCHKSQGGQWRCVFIDCPFWQDELTEDDYKWLYTAITRAVEKVYLVNFRDRFFKK